MKYDLRKRVDLLINPLTYVKFATFSDNLGGSRRLIGGLVSLSPVKRISSPQIGRLPIIKMGLSSTLNVEETIEESTMDRGLLAPNFTYIHSDTLLNSTAIYLKYSTITNKNEKKEGAVWDILN